MARRLQANGEVVYFGERGRLDRVIAPPPVASVGNEASFLQNAKMKRQSRLGRLEGIGEIAHTAFTTTQALENSESCRVGERVEENGTTSEVRDRSRHDLLYQLF